MREHALHTPKSCERARGWVGERGCLERPTSTAHPDKDVLRALAVIHGLRELADVVDDGQPRATRREYHEKERPVLGRLRASLE